MGFFNVVVCSTICWDHMLEQNLTSNFFSAWYLMCNARRQQHWTQSPASVVSLFALIVDICMIEGAAVSAGQGLKPVAAKVIASQRLLILELWIRGVNLLGKVIWPMDFFTIVLEKHSFFFFSPSLELKHLSLWVQERVIYVWCVFFFLKLYMHLQF